MSVSVVTPLIKTCRRCGEARGLRTFRLLPKRTLASGEVKRYVSNVCTPCIVKSNKANQKKSNSQLAKEARERRHARKLRAIERMGGKCSMCGLSVHPAAFDFHHIDPPEKDRDPGLMMGYSDGKLWAELAKCVLLCANCHRIHHFEHNEMTQ